MNNIDSMNWKDVPGSWGVRCSGDGNRHYWDEDGVLRYEVDDVPVAQECRPCGHCGKFPTESGEDFCLHHLGNVINACRGHGTNDGYIEFDNGVTVRGMFKIEYDKDKINEKNIDFSGTKLIPTKNKRSEINLNPTEIHEIDSKRWGKCPGAHCSFEVQEDWWYCPYCGQHLKWWWDD